MFHQCSSYYQYEQNNTDGKSQTMYDFMYISAIVKSMCDRLLEPVSGQHEVNVCLMFEDDYTSFKFPMHLCFHSTANKYNTCDILAFMPLLYCALSHC